MTMEEKKLQKKNQKINVVKKKMKRIRRDNIAIGPNAPGYLSNKNSKDNIAVLKALPPTKTIWGWIKSKFC